MFDALVAKVIILEGKRFQRIILDKTKGKIQTPILAKRALIHIKCPETFIGP